MYYPTFRNYCCGFGLDCKTVRIFAYSSTREQSNKRLFLRYAKTILRKTPNCFAVWLWPTFWFFSFLVKTVIKDGRIGFATLN